MKCTVIDGLFDELFLHELYLKINDIPLNTTNIANRRTWPYGLQGSHRLLGSLLFSRTGINRVTEFHPEAGRFFDIFETIERYLNQSFLLHEISLNVQHTNCDGSVHVDGEVSEYSILLMTNPTWNPEWGGQFQLMNNSGTEVIEEYNYIPGRIIIMPSNHPHRGLGPTEQYIYRTTVVFRVSKLPKQI
jgi:hypothetical protein